MAGLPGSPGLDPARTFTLLPARMLTTLAFRFRGRWEAGIANGASYTVQGFSETSGSSGGGTRHVWVRSSWILDVGWVAADWGLGSLSSLKITSKVMGRRRRRVLMLLCTIGLPIFLCSLRHHPLSQGPCRFVARDEPVHRRISLGVRKLFDVRYPVTSPTRSSIHHENEFLGRLAAVVSAGRCSCRNGHRVVRGGR